MADHPRDYDYEYYGQEMCGHCGGEGYTFDCWDGCCADAEIGCDLCTKRCDFCNPAQPTKDTAKLSQILGDAINEHQPKEPK